MNIVNSDSLTNVKLYGLERSVASNMMAAPESQTSHLEVTVAGNTMHITNYPTYLVPKLIEDFVNVSSKKDTLSSLGPTGLE